jgi:hypothetical protein
MEDHTAQHSVRNRLLKQRLYIWCTAIPLLGVMTYFSVIYAGDWRLFPQLPFAARLPLFLPLLLQLCILIWFVNRLLRVRSALKAERDVHDSTTAPSRPVLPAADFYVVPAVASVCLFALAIVGAAIALKLPMQPYLESFRTNLSWGAAILLVLSLLWPARVLLRKFRSGSFWLSQADVQRRKMQKPLWRRILAACVWCAIAVVVTVESGKVPRTMTSWVVVFFFWFAAFVWTVDVFRFAIARPSREERN